MKRTITLALLALALLTGCGIEFRQSKVTDDFFTALDVTGDMRAGVPISLNVQYQQNYPQTVYITCELRQKKALVKVIGKAQTVPYKDGSPKVDPAPGNFVFDFSVDAPGTYRVECLTPDDEDNYIDDKIVIGPAPEATPSPVLGGGVP